MLPLSFSDPFERAFAFVLARGADADVVGCIDAGAAIAGSSSRSSFSLASRNDSASESVSGAGIVSK